MHIGFFYVIDDSNSPESAQKCVNYESDPDHLAVITL